MKGIKGAGHPRGCPMSHWGLHRASKEILPEQCSVISLALRLRGKLGPILAPRRPATGVPVVVVTEGGWTPPSLARVLSLTTLSAGLLLG